MKKFFTVLCIALMSVSMFAEAVFFSISPGGLPIFSEMRPDQLHDIIIHVYGSWEDRVLDLPFSEGSGWESDDTFDARAKDTWSLSYRDGTTKKVLAKADEDVPVVFTFDEWWTDMNGVKVIALYDGDHGWNVNQYKWIDAPAEGDTPDWLQAGDGWDDFTRTLTVNSNPGYLAYIDNGKFKHLVISEGVTNIGEQAFYRCGSLEDVTLPSTLKSIEKKAFADCSNATTLTISDGLQSIEEYSFAYWSSLRTLALPPSLKNVGNEAFRGCSSLKTVTVYAEGLTSYGSEVFKNCGALKKIFVPSDFVETYKSNWSAYSSLIEAIPSADQVAANAVIDLINAIPATIEYTDACHNAITSARNAYDALTETQKGLVSNYNTLTDAEAAYEDQVAANAVIYLINAIPATIEYTDACHDAITSARNAYDALTETQKGLVSNYTTLTGAETAYELLTPEPAEEVTVVFATNGKTKEVNVTLPHTFYTSYSSKDGELDQIIKELYDVSSGYGDNSAPSANGNELVTAGLDGNNQFITISEAFDGTATVTGKYYNDEDDNEISYSLTISIKGNTTAIDNTVVSEKAPKRIVNGQLVIEKNGKFYNATGAEVK